MRLLNRNLQPGNLQLAFRQAQLAFVKNSGQQSRSKGNTTRVVAVFEDVFALLSSSSCPVSRFQLPRDSSLVYLTVSSREVFGFLIPQKWQATHSLPFHIDGTMRAFVNNSSCSLVYVVVAAVVVEAPVPCDTTHAPGEVRSIGFRFQQLPADLPIGHRPATSACVRVRVFLPVSVLYGMLIIPRWHFQLVAMTTEVVTTIWSLLPAARVVFFAGLLLYAPPQIVAQSFSWSTNVNS